MIAITGATGGVGSRAALRLAALGEKPRLVVRDPGRLEAVGIDPVGVGGGVAVVGGYDDTEGLRQALDGVDTLFLVPAHEELGRVELHRHVIEVASDIGVSHIVYLSFLRPDGLAEPSFSLVRDHWDTEDLLADSGLVTTFLRMSLYMDFTPMMVGADDVIRGPAGDGYFAPVCRDDIAEAAAIVLANPAAHAGAAYDLTGPERLTFTDIAAALATTTGRPITFHDETIEEARASRAVYDAPDWQVEAWIGTYLAVARGELDLVGTGVPDLTGHPATTLATFLASSTRP